MEFQMPSIRNAFFVVANLMPSEWTSANQPTDTLEIHPSYIISLSLSTPEQWSNRGKKTFSRCPFFCFFFALLPFFPLSELACNDNELKKNYLLLLLLLVIFCMFSLFLLLIEMLLLDAVILVAQLFWALERGKKIKWWRFFMNSTQKEVEDVYHAILHWIYIQHNLALGWD